MIASKTSRYRFENQTAHQAADMLVWLADNSQPDQYSYSTRMCFNKLFDSLIEITDSTVATAFDLRFYEADREKP